MPDNGGYFVAAYVVAGVVYGGYLWSLVSRGRRIRARMARDAGGRKPEAGREAEVGAPLQAPVRLPPSV